MADYNFSLIFVLDYLFRDDVIAWKSAMANFFYLMEKTCRSRGEPLGVSFRWDETPMNQKES